MQKYIVTTTNHRHRYGDSVGHNISFYDDTMYLAANEKNINLTPEIIQYAWALDISSCLFNEYHDSDDTIFSFNLSIVDTELGKCILDTSYHFDCSDEDDVESTAEQFFKEFPKWREYALQNFDALEVEHDDDESISPPEFIQKFDDIALLEMRQEMGCAARRAWSKVESIAKKRNDDWFIQQIEEIVFRMEFAEQWLKGNKGGE